MIKEKQIFLECFSGNKIDEMLPLIDILCINDYNVFYSFSGDITQYSDLSNYKNAIQLKQKDEKYFEMLNTSKWIFLNTNIMTGTSFRKKEGQVVVQLWHGVPFKYIGNDVKYSANIPNDLFTMTMNHELLQTDFFLIPNDFCSNVFEKGFSIPSNVKLIHAGYPRNDYLYTNYKWTSHEDLNIPNDKKVVLYAPTWNDKGMYGIYEFTQNINQVVEALSETHFFIFSFHPGTTKAINFNPKTSNWMINKDATLNNIDLFKVSDVLVTDFSSIMFDYALTNKPVINFFKKEEYADYVSYRGAYFDMEKENFNCSWNVNELISALRELHNLNKAIIKFAPENELATIKILEDVGLNIPNKEFPNHQKNILIIDNNFEDFIVNNPTLFKTVFKLKKLLLKIKHFFKM